MMLVLAFDVAILDDSNDSFANASDVFFLWDRVVSFIQWSFLGSPDKPRGLSIQPCKSEKEEPYIRHSSQGRSECLYLRIE